MIRVFVVDDHPIVRQGLVGVLDDEDDITVVGSSDGSMIPTDIDVLMLDLEMPLKDGLQIIAEQQGVRILVFSAYDDEDRVVRSLQAGASGYLLKGASSEEILRAIRTVHAGGSYLEPRIASRVLTQLRTPRQHLTARELEVLRPLAEGLSNKQIAARLGISERTVKFHVNSIYGKLEAQNRAQAVARAVEQKLL